MRNRVLAALAAVGVAAFSATAQVQPVHGAVREAVISELQLTDFTIQRLEIPEAHTAFETEITLGGQGYNVWVEPRSFRTAGATLTLAGEGGVLREAPLPPPLTVGAQIDGAPGSSAAGARTGEGLNLAVLLPGPEGDEVWTVQPLTEVMPDADPDLHVVYRDADVQLDRVWTCGVADAEHEHAHAEGQGDGGSRAFLVCELAFEADWEYYNIYSQNVDLVIADIDMIMARVSAVYEAQCNVMFMIPHYNVWTTSNDPYTSTDPSTRLNQFRTWWNANKGDVHRDLAHFFTGANINGGVIGVAYLSVVCSATQGYGLSQSRFTGNSNSRGALTAHEIGHNFSAGHCDGNGDCRIMCSGLGGCNGLGNPARFGQPSATKITNYAANRPCLEEGGGIEYPFSEPFAETTIDPAIWTNSGGEVNSNADNEPSDPYSLNLDGVDTIESGAIDLSDITDFPYFNFYTQHKGVEAGEQLVAEYRDINGDWVAIETIVSDGADQSAFQYHSHLVPVIAWSDQFAIRFRSVSSDATDDWYVDDIYVGPFPGNPVPFIEEFAETTLDTNVWETVSGATVGTGADNEPSPPYSLNFDGTDSAVTQSFLMADADFPTYVSFFVQRKGVENGEQFVAEYLNDTGAWAPLATFTSDGTDQNQFEFYQQSMIFDAYHDGFALRFRALGSDGTDDWHLDDIRIGDEFTPPDDCIADFNDDGNVNTQDVTSFLNAWNAEEPEADINGDGTVNTQDVSAFLNEWNAGCP